jgi:hypothetical protein
LVDASGFASEADIPRYVISADDVDLRVDSDVAEWQRGQVHHATGTMIGTEADYTFFANWVVTEPGSTTSTSYHYRLPDHAAWPSALDPAERFETYFFKQPGDVRTSLSISVNLPAEARILHTVPDEAVRQVSAHEFAYQGHATRDVLVGSVFALE